MEAGNEIARDAIDLGELSANKDFPISLQGDGFDKVVGPGKSQLEGLV